MNRTFVAVAALCVLVTDCLHISAAHARSVKESDSAVVAEKNSASWPMGGRNAFEQHYSPLSSVNEANVNGLGLTWSYDLGIRQGQEATPIVVDGVMYVSMDYSEVKALDAKTGKLLWAYDPKTRYWQMHSCCGPVNRGVAVSNGKVYVGALDGRLIALDAHTGKEIWSTQTFDKTMPYSITGAPRIAKGKVIIGNAGADFGARGFISAYDADTGKLAWRFYVVPGKDPVDHAASDKVMAEKARATWSGEFWTHGAGGTVWDGMAYDPGLDLLYIGTGNGSPWNAGVRNADADGKPPSKEGDNLFLSSIIAVRPETGAYVWHFQETPNESWDYTSVQPIVLADLKIDGKPRKVLLHAPKNGFFYVLDRTNGKFISGKPIDPNISWATGLDANGRPIENPDARYYKTGKVFNLSPSASGAHSWQPMAFDPKTGLVYLSVAHTMMPMYAATIPRKHDAFNTGTGIDNFAIPVPAGASDTRIGFDGAWLAAWDPVAQKEAWRVPRTGMHNGGVLATGGGLVFEGTEGNTFEAYRATTGEKLWSFDTQTAVEAAPSTYQIDGEQYVAVLAGWNMASSLNVASPSNGPNRILVFKIGGTKTLPPKVMPPLPEFNPSQEAQNPTQVAAGELVFGRLCIRCHGVAAVGGGTTPDLRRSAVFNDENQLKDIVLGGALKDGGMGSFADDLTLDDLKAIRAYVISRAQAAKKAGEH